jgi:uncharacterized repeat protein (TIGR03803 family)
MKVFAGFCALAVALILPAMSQARTWHYTLLHNFCTQDDCADGSFPTAGLVADTKGNLFGVTETGGTHNDGIVFELERHRKTYTLKVLHDFCFSCGDGDFPFASLIADVNGNLYGTTLGGGAHDCGIVFRLSPGTKKLKVLHDFCTQEGDGNSLDQALSYAGKNSGMLYDGASPLYGTTAEGGANAHGTVFSLTPSGRTWALTTLYAFCALSGCADGGTPSGEVLVDNAGNLFGNASLGGGGGSVYELSPAGSAPMTEKIVHSFCAPNDCPDGQEPTGALAMTPSGEIFGTTENALGSEGGAIFKLTSNGTGWDESLAHVFCSGKCDDGYLPSGGLIADSHGDIYGVDELGGAGEHGVGGGVAFRLRGNKLTPLYPFCSEENCADGRVPMGTLTIDGRGDLFGVTSQGGPVTGAGTIFQLHP